LGVVSSYPSREDEEAALTLYVSNTYKGYSAGKYLQNSLQAIFRDTGLDIYSRTFLTNTVKCYPNKVAIKDADISWCTQRWLRPELEALPPGIPLLLSGTQAVKAVFPKLKGGLYANRGQVLYWRDHPTVITLNINDVERGHPRIVTAWQTELGIRTPLSWKYAPAMIMGTRPWLFARDLLRIKSLVVDYVASQAS
jgi:hypothetical protein